MDVKKIEKKYQNYETNKAIRLIAMELGNDYNEKEKAEEYLKKIDVKTLTEKDKMLLSGVYLNLGLLEKGFDFYRFRKHDYQIPFDRKKEWNKENLTGKKIYIVAEQGIGDCIMWARFLPLLKNTNIFFYVSNQFHKNIIFLLDYVLKLTARNNNVHVVDYITDYDYFIYLADLTYIFKVHFDNWVPFYTYIQSDTKFTKLWKEKLPKNKKLIAINCTGIDGQQDHRKIEFHEIMPLLECDQFVFININIDFKVQHRNVLNFELDKTQPFIDTCAIIHCVDLVVTIDTSIVHLAGAMNAKTLLLLKKNSEWRWFDDKVSRWYPAVTILKEWGKIVTCTLSLLECQN